MQFAFRHVPVNPPTTAGPSATPPSGPPGSRPRPIVPLRVYGRQNRLVQAFVLVDTGADEIVLPTWQMARLGFSRTQVRSRTLIGFGAISRVYYCDVELELSGGAQNRIRWRTTAGFGSVPAGLGLFGVAGGLEFFQTTVSVV